MVDGSLSFLFVHLSGEDHVVEAGELCGSGHTLEDGVSAISWSKDVNLLSFVKSFELGLDSGLESLEKGASSR